MTIRPSPTEFTPDEIAQDHVLRYFHYRHLPQPLQFISALFCGMAREVITTIPRNAERTVALRKILEAKDCAVRAMLTND
jgi:hypothetical protein